MQTIAEIKRAYFIRVLEDLYTLAHQAKSDEIKRRCLTEIARLCAPKSKRAARTPSPSSPNPKRQRGAQGATLSSCAEPESAPENANPSPPGGEGRVRADLQSAPSLAFDQTRAHTIGRAHHIRCLREDINAMKLAGAKVPDHFFTTLASLTNEDPDTLRAAAPVSQEQFDALYPVDTS